MIELEYVTSTMPADPLFRERFQALMEKSLVDMKTFSERENWPLEEVCIYPSQYLKLSLTRIICVKLRHETQWQNGIAHISLHINLHLAHLALHGRRIVRLPLYATRHRCIFLSQK